MTRLSLLTALALIGAATLATAETQTPGSHFVKNWDADENGSVSLEEAITRRGDVPNQRREHDQRHHARLQQREIVARACCAFVREADVGHVTPLSDACPA